MLYLPSDIWARGPLGLFILDKMKCHALSKETSLWRLMSNLSILEKKMQAATMEGYQNVSLTFYVNLDPYSPASLSAFADAVGVSHRNCFAMNDGLK